VGSAAKENKQAQTTDEMFRLHGRDLAAELNIQWDAQGILSPSEYRQVRRNGNRPITVVRASMQTIESL
jgi:hypothetical protein